jgi:hypothetical protein
LDFKLEGVERAERSLWGWKRKEGDRRGREGKKERQVEEEEEEMVVATKGDPRK